MAHVEFKMIPLNVAGDMVDVPVNINCWRATLIFRSTRSGASFTIDGVSWDWLNDPNDQTAGVQRIEWGGLVVDGKPVNIQHDLRFTSNGEVFAALLILQYYVP